MSIKGTSKELFIGKSELNIITFTGNKITLPYCSIKRIDYCYAILLQTGHFNIVDYNSSLTKFDFRKTANDPISRAVDYIHQNQPRIIMTEYTAEEKRNSKSVRIVPTFGHKELGLSSLGFTIHQRSDGTVYFNDNTAVLFDLIDYEWGGPIYNEKTITTEKSKKNSETIKKGKALKIGVGAIAGNFVGGPIGAVVGGAMGAGSKGKSNTAEFGKKDITSDQTVIEVDTEAVLAFRNMETQNIYKISFKSNTTLDSKIKCFNFK